MKESSARISITIPSWLNRKIEARMKELGLGRSRIIQDLLIEVLQIKDKENDTPIEVNRT